ncbi:MAG: hypothetical protein GF344_09265 [Chitinivibrionales bacterium]|nr:hypothetical protein [Chitinivibrionales bacterium]MBD3357040.1 hypothetical protein [Chitinivibrionales bacterium]
MLRNPLFVFVTIGLAFFGTTAPRAAVLNLDYGKNPEWKYTMEYHSECRFTENDTTSTKKTELSCVLDGSLAEKADAVALRVKDLTVNSELYDDNTKAAMAKKLTETNFTLPLEDGAPSIAGLGDLSSDGLPEWNLYVQFAKLLPQLPQQATKKGFSWERSGRLKVRTKQGDVPCEVYRRFKVDRFSADNDTAFISWRFKYSAAKAVRDTSTLLKYVPVAGKGKGAAVIHVGDGYIVSASMEFMTPVAKVGKAKVNWKEIASLKREVDK